MIALADKITKSFGGRTLYSGATLQLNAQERWALVGPNGSGKTTLLRIIMGEESPDEGTVSFARDTTVGYLEQETHLAGEKSALAEVVDSAHEVKEVERLVFELERQISECAPGPELDQLLERYGHAQDRFERLGGYELEARARQILSGLGFPTEDFDKPARDFSGGWQMRIALSKLLLRHPDLLLLDEPTNHLDLESVKWLEQFLAGYDGAVLLVSHDRAFMDACVSHVAAVENRRITTYTGNYSSYLRQREDNLEQMRAKRAAQEREIAHMQVFVDKFRYKPTKAAQAQERMKKIEQIKSELVILPEGTKKVHFSFPEPPRTGDEVVRLEGVSKSFGENHVYSGVDLKLYRGDHVVLVTPIDSSAPKGRMILPQVQVIRDILDACATCSVTQVEELAGVLNGLKTPPKLVVTDSQAFGKVKQIVPESIKLTSFSILFARYKGVLETAVRGAAAIENLKAGDRILISEGCTHHRQCGDIGTEKLPNWIRRFTGKDVQFSFTAGNEFPEDVSKYALVVHCGGCMLNHREIQYRMRTATDQSIPFTNYGTVIALVTGTLERSLCIFPEIHKML